MSFAELRNMVRRSVTIMVGAASAALGFGTAYSLPRPEPAARVVTRWVTAPASAPPTPRPIETSAPCTSSAPPRRGPEPVAVAPTPTTAVHRPSPLTAFRFSGVGPAGGLRLGRVAPGTLPAALGLRTGDELLTVNDFKLSDPEQALLAYARLRSADRLRLAVNRGGSRAELVYFIR